MNRPFAIVLVATLSAWIGAAWAEQDKSSPVEPMVKNKKSWNDAAIKLTDDTFEKEVITSKTPIVIEFWAAWSGPSRGLSPTLQAVFGLGRELDVAEQFNPRRSFEQLHAIYRSIQPDR
jgi:thiol-disulfide isomerase/thioredoxin